MPSHDKSMRAETETQAKPPKTGPTGPKAQSNQRHKARPTMADWHQSLPPHPKATCLPLWQIHWWCKKQWKMMEHDAKIQVPRWEKLGFNTHHPNPCMGFHCQTCEHFGNGGAWEWNIFSNYCLAVSRVTVDQNTTGLLFIVKPHSQILHIRNVFEIYPLVN